ncbi:LexA family transcriptional regulator [Paenibacillus pini]|uniref:LexA repressor DNA-binding domain-containing protein n=1 Tax=Paenibacillus pini JCM 16418 TaxID=1236976 RepID=W7Y9B1_9BACL|nr:hypothetical protein [Paenibacillus pini]GAF07565.1 hypothetical protein JCM16418_1586 [Paenibacillus pini JCM 16418]
MLTDIERKVLRILFNYSSGRRRLPSMHELEVKTGKSKGEITHYLLELEKQSYIQWESKPYVQTIKILEGWDRDGRVLEELQHTMYVKPTSNIDYWTSD